MFIMAEEKWLQPLAKTVSSMNRPPKVDATIGFPGICFHLCSLYIYFLSMRAALRILARYENLLLSIEFFLDPFSINFSVCIRLVICAQKTELLPPGFSSHHHQYASASLVARSNCRQSKPRMASCSTKDEAKVLFCFAAHGELSNTLLQCSLILPIPMLNVCIPLCKGQGCLNRYLYLMILKFNKTLFTK